MREAHFAYIQILIERNEQRSEIKEYYLKYIKMHSMSYRLDAFICE